MLRAVNFPMKNKKLLSSFEFVSFCHASNVERADLISHWFSIAVSS